MLEFGSATEHTDIIAAIGIAYMLWSAKRTIAKIETTQSDLSDAVEELERSARNDLNALQRDVDHKVENVSTQVNKINSRLSNLEGEHKARHGAKP